MDLSFHIEATDFIIQRLSENNNLNQWESDFIESIKEQFKNGKKLSDKQLEKLSDLWEKY